MSVFIFFLSKYFLAFDFVTPIRDQFSVDAHRLDMSFTRWEIFARAFFVHPAVFKLCVAAPESKVLAEDIATRKEKRINRIINME